MATVHTTKDNVERIVYTCKACGKTVEKRKDAMFCPDCGDVFHKSCWEKRGGCGNPNCKSYVVEKAEPVAEVKTDEEVKKEKR